MCKLGEESFDKPRPISTVALRLEGEHWESWLPPRTAPTFAKFHELRLRTIGMEYNDQKELLDQIHQHTGEEVMVASFSALQNKQTGRISSYSVWSQGIASLLPETDEVVLLQADPAADKLHVAASGSWQRVRDVAGDLMQPQGTYPERYRVRDFPSAQQLAAIGKSDWPEP
jgi:hypothetical protein